MNEPIFKSLMPGVGRKILNLRIEHYRNLQFTEVLKHMEIMEKSLVTRYVNIFLKKTLPSLLVTPQKNRKIVFLIVIDYLQIINYYVLA